MSYGSNYGGGSRSVDMSKTEADLAINIRKATSIGIHHSSAGRLCYELTFCDRGDCAEAEARPSMYRLHLGPQVVHVLLGRHEGPAGHG